MCVCSCVSRPCWGRRVSTSTRWATLSCPSTLWPTPRSVGGPDSACRALLFFPLSAAASSSYFLLSAFFCPPLSFHVTMFVMLFFFFFPHSKIQQVASSGLKAVWCFDCGSDRKCVCPFPCVHGLWGKVSWLVLLHVLFHVYFLFFFSSLFIN